jgi:hypothetical protein
MCLMAPGPALASEYHGRVTFGGLPVPGATIMATHGSQKIVALSDQQGSYFFADLTDGAWKIVIEMQCFSTIDQTVTIAPNVLAGNWELKLLSLDQIMAQAKTIKAEIKPVLSASSIATPGKNEARKPDESNAAEKKAPEESAAASPSDGLLIKGSVNNAATSQFSLAPASANSRRGKKGLYTGGLGLTLGNSALDARPYSLSGQSLLKSQYNRMTFLAALGGPLHIPHLLPNGPNFFVAYQWTSNGDATTLTGLVPTTTERSGDLPFGVVTPVTQSQDLLKLYPLPNVAGNSLYNYQVRVITDTHQDALQLRLDKTIGNKNQPYGGFAFQSVWSSGSNLFGFIDATDTLGITTNISWATGSATSSSLRQVTNSGDSERRLSLILRIIPISQARQASPVISRTPPTGDRLLFLRVGKPVSLMGEAPLIAMGRMASPLRERLRRGLIC